MIIYKSDVLQDCTYKVEGDWIYINDKWGVIGFRISQRESHESYFKLLGSKDEPVRSEVERLIKAVEYMRKRHIGMAQEEFEENIAQLLGMKYGKYQEKKRKGEVTYIMKRD